MLQAELLAAVGCSPGGNAVGPLPRLAAEPTGYPVGSGGSGGSTTVPQVPAGMVMVIMYVSLLQLLQLLHVCVWDVIATVVFDDTYPWVSMKW